MVVSEINKQSSAKLIDYWQLNEDVGLVYTINNLLCINFSDKSTLIGNGSSYEYKEHLKSIGTVS